MKQHLKHPYYKSLTTKIILIVVTVSFLPMILSGFVFSHFQNAYYKKVHAHIVELVQKHSQNINYFLEERLKAITAFSSSYNVDDFKKEAFLEDKLNHFRKIYDNIFVDIGFVNEKGLQVSYAGPYKLIKANYSTAPWFKEAIKSKYSISDVFLGLRGHPHFILAVQKRHNGEVYILRTTIDFMSFNSLVENITIGKTGFAFILNREGKFQTKKVKMNVDETGFFSGLMNEKDEDEKDEDEKDEDEKDEVNIFTKEDNRGRKYIYATATLENGDWLFVYKQDVKDAYKDLRGAQLFYISIFILGGIIIVITAIFLSTQIVLRIIKTDKEKEMMNQQIIETGRLASIGELAAGIAHEINNPVAIMTEEAGWMNDLLEEGDINQHTKEFERSLKQINTQGRRCKDITYKLLSFARKTDAKTDDVNINEIIQDVITLSMQRAKYARVKINMNICDDIPLIKVSPSELQQVILNLINNSLDAMGKKEGSIEFITKKDNNNIVIEVIDTGPGISKEHIERIFDPFFTTKSVGKGTGLGLSICYGIIRKMEGDIKVKSIEGIGTTFIITLPIEENKNTP